MRLSVSQLRKIIKEEVSRVIRESAGDVINWDAIGVLRGDEPVSNEELTTALGQQAQKIYRDALERQRKYFGEDSDVDRDVMRDKLAALYRQEAMEAEGGTPEVLAKKFAEATGAKLGGHHQANEDWY